MLLFALSTLVGQDAASPLQLTESDGHPEVRWAGAAVFRGEPTCTTTKRCIDTARSLTTWPAWQQQPLADRLLGPHCEEEDPWACTALRAFHEAEPTPVWDCIDRPTACVALVESRPGGPFDHPLLEAACADGEARGCLLRGEDLEAEERLPWLARACELGTACDEHATLAEELLRQDLATRCRSDGAPCLELAARLPEGTSFADRTAQDWVVEACIVGDPVGCHRFDLDQGRLGVDHPEVVERIEALIQRCDAADAGACRVAGQLLRRTRQRDLRYGEALVLLEQSCRLGDGAACIEGGAYRRIGKARKHDLEEQGFLAIGCEGGHGPSCGGLGVLQLQRRKTRTAGIASLDEACREGHGEACSVLGEFERRRHPDEADALFVTACEAEDGLGCRRLGEARLGRDRLRVEHDAFVPYSQACDAGDAIACLAAARAHQRRKTTWDDEQRYERTKQGCEAGSIDGVAACRAQATLLKHGTGVDRDRTAGRALARAYNPRRPPRLLRVTLGVGVPALTNVGFEGLVPVKLPVGRLSVHGELSRVQMTEKGPIGGLLGTSGGLTHANAVVRYYLSRKGSGFYAGAGLNAQTAWLEGLDVPQEDPVRWVGPTLRTGYHAQRGPVGLGLEVGLMFVPDDLGSPLPILPTLALRLGLSPK